MDIRQNPITPNVLPLAPQRQDSPPVAGPAALAPVAPSLAQPTPSVVAISEAARSLALRQSNASPTAEQSEDADFAAAQLELMLGLLKVYTPPPPPTPQELGQTAAAEIASNREARAADAARFAEREAASQATSADAGSAAATPVATTDAVDSADLPPQLAAADGEAGAVPDAAGAGAVRLREPATTGAGAVPTELQSNRAVQGYAATTPGNADRALDLRI